MGPRLGVAAALTAAVLVTCQAASPPGGEPAAARPAATSAPAPGPATPVAVDASAPALDAAPEAAPNATDASQPWQRGGTPSPGQVHCGAASRMCDLGSEVCCMTPGKQTGSCTPKPAPGGLERHCWDHQHRVALACDEAADCPAGQACCVQDLASGDVRDHVYECAPYPCNVFEVCIPGQACKEPEFACGAPESEYFHGGKCEIREPKARCGRQTCSGDRPVCCWDGAQRRARCVASEDDCHHPGGAPPSDHIVGFRCSSPAECGGYPCAHGMTPVPTFQCSSRWAAGDMGQVLLCRTTADCPKYGERHLRGCVTDSGHPPWIKLCDYQWR